MEPIIAIGNIHIGGNNPVYFVSDVAANHDGSLDRAFRLIELAKESGADAIKTQHFRANNIVSDIGFKKLKPMGHQAKWQKSVSEVYEAHSLNRDWTERLAEHCQKVGIAYFSTPYDLETVDHLDPYVSMFKIGSGDITWHEMLAKVSSKGKPVFLATGASDIGEVVTAVDVLKKSKKDLPIVLMQCNTNYTGNSHNLMHINLNVLKTYRTMFPELVLGLSDHTFGHATVLGAVALGARVIEKHLTDDNDRIGPDHFFAMNPITWREMVNRTRELEFALGNSIKRVEENEQDTVIIQRRCIRANVELKKNTILSRNMLTMLRPAPYGSMPPYLVDRVIGRRLRNDLPAGEHIREDMLGND